MPIAEKYSLDELMGAAKTYYLATHRKLTFEYALIGGENDTDEDAGEAWNALEKSIVGKLADDVVVGVKGDRIEMVIIKDFGRR